MFYRFSNGVFVEADTFQEAQDTLLDQVRSEVEDADNWHKCTCLGFDHSFSCPENPINGDDPDMIPY